LQDGTSKGDINARFVPTSGSGAVNPHTPRNAASPMPSRFFNRGGRYGSMIGAALAALPAAGEYVRQSIWPKEGEMPKTADADYGLARYMREKKEAASTGALLGGTGALIGAVSLGGYLRHRKKLEREQAEASRAKQRSKEAEAAAGDYGLARYMREKFASDASYFGVGDSGYGFGVPGRFSNFPSDRQAEILQRIFAAAARAEQHDDKRKRQYQKEIRGLKETDSALARIDLSNSAVDRKLDATGERTFAYSDDVSLTDLLERGWKREQQLRLLARQGYDKVREEMADTIARVRGNRGKLLSGWGDWARGNSRLVSDAEKLHKEIDDDAVDVTDLGMAVGLAHGKRDLFAPVGGFPSLQIKKASASLSAARQDVGAGLIRYMRERKEAVIGHS